MVKRTYTLPTGETVENPTKQQMKSLLITTAYLSTITIIEQIVNANTPVNETTIINTNFDGNIYLQFSPNYGKV